MQPPLGNLAERKPGDRAPCAHPAAGLLLLPPTGHVQGSLEEKDLDYVSLHLCLLGPGEVEPVRGETGEAK